MPNTRDELGYTALLWLSFGGPEGIEQVMPFLENVTRGRAIPHARLLEVARHYQQLDGVSPINQLNRNAIAAVEERLKAEGLDLSVYFGNRNWHPMAEDTVARMAADGVRRALVFSTSAYGGYSACRQYGEDIKRARASTGGSAPELVKLRQFYDHPLFIQMFADGVRAAHVELGSLSDTRTVFCAHSVPLSADRSAGPPQEGGNRYSRQIAEAARLVTAAAGIATHDLVWQSRSGPARVPWLGPDIIDHLDALHSQGVTSVVVCPIGFVSDHLEVIWDLDREATEHAAELGMDFVRVPTPGSDPRFAELVVELVREHLENAPARKLSEFPAAGCTINGASCVLGCCEPVRSAP